MQTNHVCFGVHTVGISRVPVITYAAHCPLSPSVTTGIFLGPCVHPSVRTSLQTCKPQNWSKQNRHGIKHQECSFILGGLTQTVSVTLTRQTVQTLIENKNDHLVLRSDKSGLAKLDLQSHKSDLVKPSLWSCKAGLVTLALGEHKTDFLIYNTCFDCPKCKCLGLILATQYEAAFWCLMLHQFCVDQLWQQSRFAA